MGERDSISRLKGLARRTECIALAGDDRNFDDAKLQEVQARCAVLSTEELQGLADMHILFNDKAPVEVMLDFWLRRRLAAEMLATRAVDKDFVR